MRDQAAGKRNQGSGLKFGTFPDLAGQSLLQRMLHELRARTEGFRHVFARIALSFADLSAVPATSAAHYEYGTRFLRSCGLLRSAEKHATQHRSGSRSISVGPLIDRKRSSSERFTSNSKIFGAVREVAVMVDPRSGSSVRLHLRLESTMGTSPSQGVPNHSHCAVKHLLFILVAHGFSSVASQALFTYPRSRLPSLHYGFASHRF